MSLLSAVLQTAEAVEVSDSRILCAHLSPQLKELAERARLLSCVLRERLVESYVNYSSASLHIHLECFRQARRVRADYERLITEAGKLVAKDSPGGHIEELKNCVEELSLAHEGLSDLCQAVEASESIARAGVEFQRADIAAAVSRLDSVVENISALKLEGDADVAVRNIRSAASGKRALFLTQLGKEWEEMLSWSERCGTSHVTYSLLVHQGDAPRLHALLQSLYKVRRLHDEMSEFAEFFIDKIVKSIINSTCDIFTDENVDTIIFSIKFERSDERRPNFQSIFTNLTAVLEFLQSATGVTFPDGCTLISVLSQLIADRFFDILITNCIKKYLPDCESSYQQYKHLAAELDAFNKFLADVKFVGKCCSPLDKYLTDMNTILYKRKCEKLLNQSRRLLSESLSHSTLVVSGDMTEGDTSTLNTTDIRRDTVHSPLMLPRCVVSESVRSVLALITAHLTDACKHSEQYSSQLVGYIADIVVMYETLVPSIYAANLKDNPFDIALFFNNSFYLAHGLLGSPWSSTLPPHTADSLNTVLAPALTDLRTLGLHYLSSYLRKQKNSMQASISNEPISWSHDTYEKFENAVTSSLKIMQTLKGKWSNILPTAMYDKAMSSLVETFCQTIVSKIFNTSNKYVEEDLILMMATRIEVLVGDIRVLYKETVDLPSAITIWQKFSQMPTILKAQLFEMTTLWSAGAGATALVYSCEDIRHIIKIRFPDDDNRLKILAEIQ